MTRISPTQLVAMAVTFAAGLAAGALLRPPEAQAQANARVFEMRTYTAPDGKLDALKGRFRDHELRLLAKHGIANVAYWVPQDEPRSRNTLVWVIAYPNREEAKARWNKFQADPEWQKVRVESEARGRLVSKAESVFLHPTDFSPLK